MVPLACAADTEIDWVAYMQEVEGWLGGEYDYTQLRGDTGPLPYPAGFLYVFAALRWATNDGQSIWAAQWIFLGIYLATVAAVLVIYGRARCCPPWVAILVCASRRVHSIYVLRLFNDGVAMALLYVAVYYCSRRRWTAGCLWLSLATSIKMNILLFVPPIGLLMLRDLGVLRTIPRVLLCFVVQLALGAPFLLTYPASYIGKAFDLSRAFFHKWSVNYAFLDVDFFEGNALATPLLAGTAGFLLVFLYKWTRWHGGLVASLFRGGGGRFNDSAAYIVTLVFTGNFIGIVFSRTLHYQFYSWYFHTLPLLLWRTTLPTPLRLLLLAGIELAFNVFPATSWSSALLQVCHGVILLALLVAPLPLPSMGAVELRETSNAASKSIAAIAAAELGTKGGDADNNEVSYSLLEADERGVLIRQATEAKLKHADVYVPFGGHSKALLQDTVTPQRLAATLQDMATAADKRRS